MSFSLAPAMARLLGELAAHPHDAFAKYLFTDLSVADVRISQIRLLREHLNRGYAQGHVPLQVSPA